MSLICEKPYPSPPPNPKVKSYLVDGGSGSSFNLVRNFENSVMPPSRSYTKWKPVDPPPWMNAISCVTFAVASHSPTQLVCGSTKPETYVSGESENPALAPRVTPRCRVFSSVARTCDV